MRQLDLARGIDTRRVRMAPARAEAQVFEIRGKRLALDTNTLGAWELAPGEDPPVIAAAPQFAPGGARGFRTVVLEITHGCNLECSYCFVRNYNDDHSRGVMPMDVAIRGVGLLARAQSGGTISVGFFGGEPLLAFARMKDIVAYVECEAARTGARAQFSVTTNGTLLDDEKAAWLGRHGFSMIVSLDGPAEVHDRHRPNRDGNSHAQTLAPVRRLADRRGIGHVTLRSTFTGDAGLDLVERLEYLNALCDEGCADHVSVEPVSLSETGCIALPDGHDLAITAAKAEAMRGQYALAAEWYRDRLRSGRDARFHHFYKMLERIAWREPSPSECGAGCGYAAVGPDGNIYACHREGNSRIGHVETGVDESLRAKWCDNRLYAREGCPECPVRWACGGGCRLDSLDQGLGISVPDRVSCIFKRAFVEEALWLMSELTPAEIARATRRKLPEGACRKEAPCTAAK